MDEIFAPPMDGLNASNFWGSFLPFFYVLIVLALIIGVCWFLLRLTGSVRKRGGTSGNLQLLESIFIASQNAVQLVRAGDKYLVIGVTKERVTLLAELDVSQIKEAEALPPLGTSFSKVLERFLPPKDEPPHEKSPNEEPESHKPEI
ncbi:MAG: flagellar biosynthetic protein FliO [Defluviitaleaceae bacterium]|nr:flagellar biosynthetic protein FliO [Defluviitaleaceae bacterium]MCL2240544.1 flagellar biosynthetic protein FliO [Defluviitaleaceae bacterium]